MIGEFVSLRKDFTAIHCKEMEGRRKREAGKDDRDRLIGRERETDRQRDRDREKETEVARDRDKQTEERRGRGEERNRNSVG